MGSGREEKEVNNITSRYIRVYDAKTQYKERWIEEEDNDEVDSLSLSRMTTAKVDGGIACHPTHSCHHCVKAKLTPPQLMTPKFIIWTREFGVQGVCYLVGVIILG